MRKIALLLTLTLFFVAQSCSNEEAKEATSEYYTYASILGKWFAIDSDNSEYYEFFKNASYVHTQGDSIEKGDFSYNIEESTIFCKPDNKGLYTIKVVHAGQTTFFYITEKECKRTIRVQQQ